MGDSSPSPSSSSSAEYIHKVHRLIEECILFNMSREECMDALAKHAGIQPVVTSTVWKELEKENRGFFEAYAKERGELATTMTPASSRDDNREIEANRRRIRKILSDSTKVQP
ncbi:hypothetical protein MLD38_020266 [Melastoma candidum]|uniref:Uncharacterized protein n=1 Tax=Melastoma candidum TaxID=119954 RepID=A0ACB9QCK1_9MYRT|nr:hypothetical protein MLD38_020266 [Melastoma candidum]